MAQPTDPDETMRQAQPSLWQIFLLILAVMAVLGFFSNALERGPEQISYTRFKQDVTKDKVARVTIRGDEIRGRFKPAGQRGKAETAQAADKEGGKGGADSAGTDASAPKGKRFVTTKPRVDDPQLLGLLEKHDVTVDAESPTPAWWQQALIGVLPWILIFGVFLWYMRRTQQRMMGGEGGPGGIFGFAKSKAKRFREAATETRLSDVAGLENTKNDLKEIIDHLAHPEPYRLLGAQIPKGVLLVGAPGTGKTLLARAVAGEAGVPFYSISGSEFVEMFVGVGAARVRDMFESAKKEAPCVIFIDEIDAVGRARGTGLGGGHDEREQTLNQILSEMDGFTTNQNVVVLAATNRPDVLDKALLRPGRFDRKVFLDMPDKQAREAILKVHARKVPLADDVDLATLAARTVGFSGADLRNLVNEAALLAGRDRKDAVEMATFGLARDKLVLGAERERGLDDEERRLVAYHESGHALMAWLLPEADPLDKVTIIPRGRALGATEQLPEAERMNLKGAYLRDRIGVMLGGRVAEQVIFGDVTSGAESDLDQATGLARRMVCRWGMSEVLGPVAFKRGDESVFLGREIAQQQDFSDATARLIDEEVKRLLDESEDRDRRLMEKHRPKLERLAETLLDEETLERERIDALLRENGEDQPRRTGTGG